MADVDVRLDRKAIRALETDPATTREVLDAGQALARVAAAMAPRRTGAGAGSIAAELSTEERTAADVSWSNNYPYMIFHEDGTRYVPAQHFLLSAFESYIHV